ncbi:MAG: TetR/AcrR family transcriptional regulator [Bacteroidia bacterium]|nr:TetR/AcrR family transcriptional regulator [Bacteroidia bacterium]MBT8267883.1 TetR/AcrR family transcriptional regulator [Bacteroidia bacterium]NNF83143.1 TetR/AcrR family transcriptional regulator [Flavobacteriaceae bacterium]NNK71239.1 TetR/AcrR family transcriptional regulator [Flavobacteriaceae bacterium]NNL79771.1 TetR/AcrR family transcriptional regulator [Flavobacteriaceae bacterium]
MINLLSNLKIQVPDKIFIKDPESSKLGKRIIEHGIMLIDEIGFDSFTFKKLGAKIGSNESSIYRYFENKHMFLLYMTSWYWAWIEYQMVFATHSIVDKDDRLIKAIEIVTREINEDVAFTHIDEVALNRIVINEYSKSYLTKEVDTENKEGFFMVYKRLVTRIKDMILAINPKYSYASTLASTIIEGALHQHFLKDHFKSITDCGKTVTPSEFFISITMKSIKS